MKSKLLLIAVIILLAITTPLLAADVPVLRVVVIQTDDPDAYIKDVLETGQAHNKRRQSTGTLRIWKAKFAGRDAGSVVVTIEYPGLAALAEDDRKVAADPEMLAWLKGLDKKRKIVSDSLYVESK